MWACGGSIRDGVRNKLRHRNFTRWPEKIIKVKQDRATKIEMKGAREGGEFELEKGSLIFLKIASENLEKFQHSVNTKTPKELTG